VQDRVADRGVVLWTNGRPSAPADGAIFVLRAWPRDLAGGEAPSKDG
jgi:hypothetical protein